MKHLVVVTVEDKVISTETGETVNPTWEEKLLDSFLNEGKFYYQEIYHIKKNITAKTVCELYQKLNEYEQNAAYNYFLYRADLINKKAGLTK